ncbi:proteasome alpha subunit [Amycolatopsis mediterranei S699]|uniref:Proteasome subunit alpha n=2 Tax=Amycolatopsis mediterranei TaxID=33910 RepID=A0A0H3DAT2_AMYMU|nr:proteasome subunit alpha [Amycolatopsis mediterranei]ADJ46659.1 proteasome alpha subunit [Amycolatopsis mediterranei U32]AEK43459.1 proteasome subunit alpha [Amycolatopsis mediterranei S699]AFO78370.1 proteasome alpha subunit [Amycolatopsis mediterranei S699]AGT85498.1 proteasome alpha subunit [Amycolatopsis mediterranei RB]KDO11439.1 proteasome subunit alpha [Amycolatopsis mediterranei]
MTMPLYASPEQLMRERSELARKGIARGRSVVVLKYSGGVLFVAENPSATLHKVSEIYDRIGFAAVGRYSEFENLRVAGIRHADLKGYQYDRRDVSARALANAYAATLGSIFTEQLKPFEVEVCVAEVGASAAEDQLYRLTYDGSIFDEPQYIVMGGQNEKIAAKLKETFEDGLDLQAALGVAVAALRTPTQPAPSTTSAGSSASSANASANGNGDADPIKLEVAVLDRDRPRRSFRRLTGTALDTLLPVPDPQGEEPESKPEGD